MIQVVLAVFAAWLVAPTAAWAAQPQVEADQAAVVAGNNAFAVELYAQLKSQPGNLFFSPASISTALAMAYAGARGDTAAEMAKTLHFTLPPKRLHPAMGALLDELNSTHDGYTLRVANALWGQSGYTFLDEFVKLTREDYGAGFQTVDFKRATEAARLTINGWVEQRTASKIKDLIGEGVLTPATRLVLTNAVYFKGDWETQFNEEQTFESEFYAIPEHTARVPMMRRTGRFNYLDGDGFQAVEIPYKESNLSLIVFLPKDTNGLPAFEQSLTTSNLRKWLGHLNQVHEVHLFLPRFKVEADIQLNGILGMIGIGQAFRRGADFSGMSTDPSLFISAVIHKAFGAVDEAGTEAAAASGVMMKHGAGATKSDSSVFFRADHAFVFLVRDNRSGSVLFLGRVTNPALGCLGTR